MQLMQLTIVIVLPKVLPLETVIAANAANNCDCITKCVTIGDGTMVDNTMTAMETIRGMVFA